MEILPAGLAYEQGIYKLVVIKSQNCENGMQALLKGLIWSKAIIAYLMERQFVFNTSFHPLSKMQG